MVPTHCDAALLCRAQRLAFTAWREGILVQREYSNKLQRAVGFFAQSTLAAAWNGWWAALAHKRENQDKVAASVARLLQRDLARSWQSWRGAVAWRHMKLQASCPADGAAVFSVRRLRCPMEHRTDVCPKKLSWQGMLGGTCGHIEWRASCLMGLTLKSCRCLAESPDHQIQLLANRQVPHIAAIISMRATVAYCCWYSRVPVQLGYCQSLDWPNCCSCMAEQFPVIPQAGDHCTQQRMSKAFWAMQRAVRLQQTGALILQRMLHRRLAAAWCTWLDMVAVRQSGHCAGSALSSPRILHASAYNLLFTPAWQRLPLGGCCIQAHDSGHSLFWGWGRGWQSKTAVSRSTTHLRLQSPAV